MSERNEKIAELEKQLKAKLYSRMPDYIFSNDLFESWIKENLKPDTVWIDAGCGNNSLVEEFSSLSAHGIGVDTVIHPMLKENGKFIKADLAALPFQGRSVDLIIANMVVEHLGEPKKVFNEFHRVLKPGGNLIFRTTNKMYPTLLIGHLFSKKIKDKIINKIFGVRSHDIFPTHYKINTYNNIKKLLPGYGFEIIRLKAIEDLHLFHPLVFELSYRLYKIQKQKSLYFFRNTLVCQAKKL